MGSAWDSFGLRLWEGSPPPMREAHQHDEIEFNVVRTGEVTYLFDGEPLTLHADELLLFWGARPHRLVACAPGTRFFVLTLPLGTFLRFGLPDRLTGRVLRGEPVVAPAHPTHDAARLDAWLTDPDDPESEYANAAPKRRGLNRLEGECVLSFAGPATTYSPGS